MTLHTTNTSTTLYTLQYVFLCLFCLYFISCNSLLIYQFFYYRISVICLLFFLFVSHSKFLFLFSLCCTHFSNTHICSSYHCKIFYVYDYTFSLYIAYLMIEWKEFLLFNINKPADCSKAKNTSKPWYLQI